MTSISVSFLTALLLSVMEEATMYRKWESISEIT
jgi:hypothetical protein